MRVLSGTDVEHLLTDREAIDAVEEVFRRVGTEVIVQPVRSIMQVPGRPAVLASMPAYLHDNAGGFGLKVVVVDPDNASRGHETHQGVVIAFDPVNNVPSAVVEASSLTAIRTAAASAVATKTLARVRTKRAAVLGTGRQARMHLRMLMSVHPLETATLWGRDLQRAEGVATWAREKLDLQVEVCGTVREATYGADVISTVTSAREPILTADDVAPGTHINAVGSCFPTSRELSTDIVERSHVVVDRRDSAQVEAGDLLLAAAEGWPDLHRSAELGEVLRGTAPGRRESGEITVFESLGFAALDVATTHRLTILATSQGVGSEISFGAEGVQ